ncbi:DnaJ-related protein scj1 [Balamuthia mandrillaris]
MAWQTPVRAWCLFCAVVVIYLALAGSDTGVLAGKDYYRILNVPRDASQKQIKKSFRDLSMKYHPDKNPDPEAAEKFAELSEAYQILSDDEMRQKYDRFGEEGIKGGGAGGGGGGSFQFRDPFNMFQQFFQGGAFEFRTTGGGTQFHFGGGGGGGGGGYRSTRQQRQHQPPPPPKEEEAPLYTGTDDVILLSGDSFDKNVLEHPDLVWLVQFYSQTCPHCHKLAEEYKKAAKSLRGMVKVAVLEDSPSQKDLLMRYNIKGFPTILKFPYQDPSTVDTQNVHVEPIVYDGARHADAIADFAVRDLPSFVTVLTSHEEMDTFLNGQNPYQPVVLLFTNKKVSPPMFNALSKDFKALFKFGMISSVDEQGTFQDDIMKRYSLEKELPTIVFVEPSNERVTAYTGVKTYLELRRFLVKMSSSSGAAAHQHHQHSTQSMEAFLGETLEVRGDTFERLCPSDGSVLCVVSLVDALEKAEEEEEGDNNAERRRNRQVPKEKMETMRKLESKYAKDKFEFVWMDAARQSNWREGIGLAESGATPLLFVWNTKRSKFVAYEGKDYTEEAISTFLDAVVGGDKRWTRLSAVPQFV